MYLKKTIIHLIIFMISNVHTEAANTQNSFKWGVPNLMAHPIGLPKNKHLND